HPSHSPSYYSVSGQYSQLCTTAHMNTVTILFIMTLLLHWIILTINFCLWYRLVLMCQLLAMGKKKFNKFPPVQPLYSRPYASRPYAKCCQAFPVVTLERKT